MMMNNNNNKYSAEISCRQIFIVDVIDYAN